jgi:hypothetical protein
VNTRHEVLDWFELSRGVIAIRLVLLCYAIEIDSPIFLLGSFRVFLRMFRIVFDVDLSSLFIVRESPHRV